MQVPLWRGLGHKRIEMTLGIYAHALPRAGFKGGAVKTARQEVAVSENNGSDDRDDVRPQETAPGNVLTFPSKIRNAVQGGGAIGPLRDLLPEMLLAVLSDYDRGMATHSPLIAASYQPEVFLLANVVLCGQLARTVDTARYWRPVRTSYGLERKSI